MRAPEKFLSRMRSDLGADFEKLEACYQKPPYRGLRGNPLKCTDEKIATALGITLQKTPFAEHSFYLPEDAPRLGTHPLHHAGAFYLQEPSAGCAVTALSPQKGEHILDLCAAPGGKSTQIAAAMEGEGLLWCNEIIRNRANVLLSNIERMGIRNAVVSSCRPDVLCSKLEGFFDKVLVDAPCSGEGMFRKEEQASLDWSPEHVTACAQRQLAILDSAALAVKEGGILVYSTCTFSQEENEGVVTEFLKTHDFCLEEISEKFGRPGFGMPEARRIFPMDGGEGHFAVRMRRLGRNNKGNTDEDGKELPEFRQVQEFLENVFFQMPKGKIFKVGTQLLIAPFGLLELKGLGVIRAGVLLGELRSNRIEPAHALFQAAEPQNLRRLLNFPSDSQQAAAFLRGEELDAPEEWKGYTGVSVDGVMTGFGKCSGGRLKNHYPKGLRNLR